MVFSFSLLKIARLILSPLGQSVLYRIILQESYTNILCLTAKEISLSQCVWSGDAPKTVLQWSSRICLKIFFLFILAVWNLNGE